MIKLLDLSGRNNYIKTRRTSSARHFYRERGYKSRGILQKNYLIGMYIPEIIGYVGVINKQRKNILLYIHNVIT